jgi:hypothetical protein
MQRIEFIVQIEPTAHVVNESASCRTGHDRAARRKNFATKLRDIVRKIFAGTFGRGTTNFPSAFYAKIETGTFSHCIQHPTCSADQFWSTAFTP